MSLISDRAKAMLGKLAFNDADIEMMELADAANAGAATMKNEPSLKTSAWGAPMRKEDIIGKGLVGFPNSEIIDATEAYLYPDMDLEAWQAGGPMGQITVRLEDGREVTLLKRFDNLQLYDRTAAKTAGLGDESDPAHIEVSDDTEAMWPWEIDEVEEVKQLTADPAVASLNVWGQNRRSIEVVTPSKTAAADETEPIARWESAGGRWWVSLFRSGDEVYYRAVGAGGSLGNVSDEEAIANIEARLDDFQADANVTPMRRVALNPQSGHGESDLETPEIPNEHDPTPMWEWEIDELESEARLDKGVDDDLFL